MLVKKSGGKILGIRLNASERRAMETEIRKEFADYDRNNAMEIDALVLWVLHEVFGFGPTRLKRFHDTFVCELQELLRRYEMEECDQVWLCTHMLREYGINIEEWWMEDADNVDE